jgi:hypothetical protein
MQQINRRLVIKNKIVPRETIVKFINKPFGNGAN